MQIDWNKLAAVSQVVGTAAVVVTLIFLTLQTRQQTQAITANTRQGALDVEVNLIQEMMHDTVLWKGGTPAVPGMDAELATKLMLQDLVMFRSRENLWLQYRDGALDEDIWATYRDVLVLNLLDQKGNTNKNWEFLSPTLNPGFVAEMNLQMQKGAVSVPRLSE